MLLESSASEFAMIEQKLLRVSDLVVHFYTRDGIVHAVNGVSFEIEQGETLAIVGESGCGKSVTAMSLLRLIPVPPGRIESGEVVFLGRDLFGLDSEEMRKVRGREIAVVLQDPMTSLNPVLTIGSQVTEVLEEHLELDKHAARERATALLTQVGIPMPRNRLKDYPHQLSGGMRQRVMIAMALACTPKLLIADEPTTALDVTIQAQIIKLVKRLRRESNMAIIWITHDLGVVAGLADRVAVFYGGLIVEEAPVGRLYSRPQHPYTKGLLGSLPRIDTNTDRLQNIEGSPPDMLGAPKGCPFGPRCAYAFNRCWDETPRLLPVDDGHHVACWWDMDRGGPRDV